MLAGPRKHDDSEWFTRLLGDQAINDADSFKSIVAFHPVAVDVENRKWISTDSFRRSEKLCKARSLPAASVPAVDFKIWRAMQTAQRAVEMTSADFPYFARHAL